MVLEGGVRRSISLKMTFFSVIALQLVARSLAGGLTPSVCPVLKRLHPRVRTRAIITLGARALAPTGHLARKRVTGNCKTL